MVIIPSVFVITIIFVIFVPLYLKNSNDINPTKNIFDDFVENDHGYPWSWENKRIASYKRALDSKKKFKNER